jgi:uncharacterized protein (TIGR02147 family)
MKAQIEIQRLLRQKLTEAQQNNPRYSLRAFAGRTGLAPGALSAILNGKRSVSPKLATKICQALLLDPQERGEILRHFSRRESVSFPKDGDLEPKYRELSAAQFRIVSEWQHFAILSLLNTRGFKSDPEWIARRLGITTTAAKTAIERLMSLEMLTLKNGKKLVRSDSPFRTSDDLADVSIRKSHEEGLDLAKDSLRKHPLTERDHSTITMAIDPARIAEAKARIRAFQDDLSELMESGHQQEVYRLAIQLFPLTVIEKGDIK